MSKKLTKHGNSLALIIDKPLLDVLKINEKTKLEIIIEGGDLIIRPVGKKQASRREESVDSIAKKIMEKYAPVFKKLAKDE